MFPHLLEGIIYNFYDISTYKYRVDIFCIVLKKPLIFFFLGKYYLVDVRYANMKGYLAPYKSKRYHIPDFRDCSQPQGEEKVFNHAHSSLRNVIERTIGIWRNIWHILRDMKPFPLKKQEKIIVATTTLHNFIGNCGKDDEFDKCDRNRNYAPQNQKERNMDEEWVYVLIEDY